MNSCFITSTHPRYARIIPPLSGRISLTVSTLLTLVMMMSGFRTDLTSGNYSAQANIIYHFTKYIDWPASKKTGDFIIAVAGKSPIYEVLINEISHKQVNGRKIIIEKFNPSSKSFDCHILFLAGSESHHIKRIAKQTEDTPTLLVSEYDDLASKGSCINFTYSGETLKLEINRKNIEDRHLAIANELIQLGTIVNYEQ